MSPNKRSRKKSDLFVVPIVHKSALNIIRTHGTDAFTVYYALNAARISGEQLSTEGIAEKYNLPKDDVEVAYFLLRDIYPRS